MDEGTGIAATREGDRWLAEGGGLRIEMRRDPDGTWLPGKRMVPEGEAGAPALAEAAAALAAAVGPGDRVLAWEGGRHAAWTGALLAAGFRPHRRKLFVERPLAGPLPDGAAFRWRTLAECGDREFLARLAAASEGDPHEEGERDHEREWRGLLEHAGEALDRDLWRVALVDGADAGVVLPTVFPRFDPVPGTLSYVGLLPPFRGRGLGRALHAEGLRLLAGAGAAVYRGSTDDRNAAMARVFERNGCPVKGVHLLLRGGEAASDPDPPGRG